MWLRRRPSWQWIVLALVLLVALDWWIRRPDSRSRELTAAIASQGSAQLKSYPYQFRVLRVDGKTAHLSTPRNYEVPAFRALAVLYPELNVKDANNPDFIAAEKTLGAVQAEARQIVLAQPGIGDVRWQLDKEWLAAHYIELPAQ